jgi:SRSO17 transposase
MGKGAGTTPCTHHPSLCSTRTSSPGLAYLQGLLSSIERKNGWSLAEHAREASPYGMQRLLVGSVWDAGLVRDDLCRYVLEHLGDPEAVLAIDETSFPKRGDKSAGVQIQYCGTTGQVENCQVGVFLSYVTERSHTLIDRELYLPLSWTSNRQRCQAAGIPDTVRFQTKCELAIQMLERVSAAQIPFAWVVADSVYGSNLDLRTWLEQHHHSYVLAVACDELVGIRTADGQRCQVEVHEVEALLLADAEQHRYARSQEQLNISCEGPAYKSNHFIDERASDSASISARPCC